MKLINTSELPDQDRRSQYLRIDPDKSLKLMQKSFDVNNKINIFKVSNI